MARFGWLRWLVLVPAAACLWLGGPAIWWLWIGAVFGSRFVSQKRWLRPTAILLTPLAVVALSFVGGALRYATGTARLMYWGMPGPGFYNLDPSSRASPSTIGCVGWGTEPLTQRPNNAAVSLLGSLFGPMPGAYRGPYPSKDESIALLADAPDVAGPAALHVEALDWRMKELKPEVTWKAKSLADGALLLQASHVREQWTSKERTLVWLIDAPNQRVIAEYEPRD